ncbi:MAG: OmpA family protein [Treponema sp.]
MCSFKLKIIFVLFFSLLFVANGEENVLPSSNEMELEQASTATGEVEENKAKDVSADFFVYGSFQTFMAVATLKDYTQPKPGWRLSSGYTFFHQKKHSVPLYFETGHSVVSGINPLVRTFDIFPLMMNIGYEWSPFSYLTIGANVGFGMFISNIKHYPTSLDLLQNKIKSTTGVGTALSSGVSFGTNFLERNIELRASFSLDVILEKPQIIPLPSFQIGMRCYPKGIYNYSKKKGKTKIIERIVEKKIGQEVKKEDLTQYETMYVYFLPESADLDINAISQVKKAADRLKEHSELYILFEGSTAQFGSVMGRQQLEAERVGRVTEYLQKDCGIDKSRILYTPKIKEDIDKKEKEKKGEAYYTQYRWVRMRFIRIYFNFNSGEKNVYAE